MLSILRIKQRPKHLARIVERLDYYHTRDASAALGMTVLLVWPFSIEKAGYSRRR